MSARRITACWLSFVCIFVVEELNSDNTMRANNGCVGLHMFIINYSFKYDAVQMAVEYINQKANTENC
jgi:hypothetical protein